MDKQSPTSSTEQKSAQTDMSLEPTSTPIKKDSDIDTDSIIKFIKEICGKALETFKNPKLMGPLLIAGGISWLIAVLPIVVLFTMPPLVLIVAPVTLILGIMYSFSMANITLQASKGVAPTIGDATKPFPRIINYIISYILILIQFIIRLFQPPFILPGFKYAIGSGLFILENLENDTPNEQAIEKSQAITKGNLLNIFCLILSLTVVSVVLTWIPLTFSIATILTAPFTGLCVAHTYLKLKK